MLTFFKDLAIGDHYKYVDDPTVYRKAGRDIGISIEDENKRDLDIHPKQRVQKVDKE